MQVTGEQILTAVHDNGRNSGRIDVLEKNIEDLNGRVRQQHDKNNDIHVRLNRSDLESNNHKNRIDSLEKNSQQIMESVTTLKKSVETFIKGAWVFTSVMAIITSVVLFGGKLGVF